MTEGLMHSPRLVTVLMVEKELEKAKEIITVAELKRRLPKKIMHTTLLHILDYLQYSGKVLITTKGILWVYRTSEQLEKLKEGGIEL